MNSDLTRVGSYIGSYYGMETNHHGETFLGKFHLVELMDGKCFQIRYVSCSPDAAGSIFHSEVSTLSSLRASVRHPSLLFRTVCYTHSQRTAAWGAVIRVYRFAVRGAVLDKKLFVGAVPLFVLVLSACGGQGRHVQNATVTSSGGLQTGDAPSSGNADRAWVARAVRILGAGRRATSEDMARFVDRPKAEVVDELMAQTAFAATVLDFGLTFLGQPPEPARNMGNYLDSYSPANVFDSTRLSAVAAAAQFAQGGEFFGLLDYKPTPFALKLLPVNRDPAQYAAREGLPELGNVGSVLAGSDSSIRSAIIEHLGALTADLRARFDALRQGTADGPPQDDHPAIHFLCGAITDDKGRLPTSPDENPLPGRLFAQRFSAGARFMGLQGWVRNGLLRLAYGFDDACIFDPDLKTEDRLALVDVAFDELAAALKQAPDFVRELEEGSARAGEGLAALVPVDPSRVPLPDLPFGEGALGLDFYGTYPNSSTNFNRKRAAAVLKRYFCDDLGRCHCCAIPRGADFGSVWVCP